MVLLLSHHARLGRLAIGGNGLNLTIQLALVTFDDNDYLVAVKSSRYPSQE